MSTFQFDLSTVEFNGHLVTGFGDSAVEITLPDEEWTNQKKCDGGVVSSKQFAKTANVKITLRFNSTSNAILKSYLVSRTTGPLAFTSDDGTRHRAAKARIQKEPELTVGSGGEATHGDFVWTFFCERYESNFSTGEA